MLEVRNLRVNQLDEADGVGADVRFGWVLECDRPNTVQRSWRLQIARDGGFEDLVLDTGEVADERSVHVRPKGLRLEPSTIHHARVRVADGVEWSGWSPSVRFITALAGPESWACGFISAESDADADNSKGTRLRCEFETTGEIRSAILHVTALGLYEVWLNGCRVGTDEMAPGWTSYHRHLCVRTHDVTPLVRQGANAVGAMLGAGWYKGLMGFSALRNHYGRQTALLCRLEIVHADGSKQVVATDAGWRGADAPVLFSEIYDGEIYDARLEDAGWAEPGFDDAGWRTVSAIPYDLSVLAPQPGCAVKAIETLPAKRFLRTPKGERVVDFGQNLTGRTRFRVRGEAGEEVVLRHFEVLDGSGCVYLDNLRLARQEVRYVLRGDEAGESFMPHFTFHGFQYVQIVKWPGIEDGADSPFSIDIEAVVLHSDMRPTGRFACSNPDLNGLQHNILWGMKGNFLDVPTDCPQRDERMGWTGDAQIFCRTASFLMDASNFYAKWLRDVEADQQPDGGVAHVVPDIVTGHEADNWLLSQGTHSAAAWADVAVILPWTMYLAYGDPAILETQYESMKAWVEYMRRHSKDGIWNYRLQFGDWVALDAKEGSYFGATPNDLVCSAYFALSSGLMAKAAAVLGRDGDAAEYAKLHDEVVAGFRREFFTPTGRLAARTQTAHILALHFGLTPEAHLERTIRTLCELLDEQDGHLVTGFVGTPYFCHALSANGRLKEAYDLLLKDDFPSWLYQVKAGATTVWEHWDGIRPDGTMWSADMNSFNHYAYGAVGDWMYRTIGGLDTREDAPGYRHAIVAPQVGGGLEWAETSLDTVYGELASNWHVRDGIVELEVRVPCNARATVRLDQAVTVSEAAGSPVGIRQWEIGSGRHLFRYSLC